MAKQYPANDPGNTNDTTRVVPVAQNTPHNAVEVYEAPKKRGFPWWVLLFGLIPLLLLFNRSNDQRTEPTTTATPVAVTSPAASPSASPGMTNDGVSRTGSAALPPSGGTSSVGSTTTTQE